MSILASSLRPNSEIRILTLDEYVLVEEFDLYAEDRLNGIRSPFLRSDQEIILDLIKSLTYIRMFVVWPEHNISNPWIKLWMKKESNIQRNTEEEYIGRSLYIKHGTVEETTISDLSSLLNNKWYTNGLQIQLKSVDEIVSDELFKKAVKFIIDSTSNNDCDWRIAFWLENAGYTRDAYDFSDGVREKRCFTSL